MSTLRELANIRESCRHYADRPVSREDLVDMVQTAILSPNASNRQSWRFVIAQGDKAQKVADLCGIIPGNNAWAHEVSAFIIISSTVRESRVADGQPHDFPTVDAGIAAGYLCLAAAEKGLATCIIGSADEEGIKKLFDIDPERRVHILLAVGYPADAPKMTHNRLAFEELVTLVD